MTGCARILNEIRSEALPGVPGADELLKSCIEQLRFQVCQVRDGISERGLRVDCGSVSGLENAEAEPDQCHRENEKRYATGAGRCTHERTPARIRGVKSLAGVSYWSTGIVNCHVTAVSCRRRAKDSSPPSFITVAGRRDAGVTSRLRLPNSLSPAADHTS